MRIALAAAAMVMSPFLLSLGSAEARTWRIAPGPEAQTELQNALSRVEPGDTVRLDRGRFELTRGLTLSVRGVEVRGDGADRTVLSFAGQQDQAAGLTVTGPAVVLRDFAVEDTRGDGIVARDCEGVTMRALRVQWARGVSAENGAYGLHAVNCSNMLIEDSIARNAAAAAIGVTSSRTVIVRRNVAEQATAGIAIENTYHADVFENTAQHNAGGIVVLNLPALAQPDGNAVRVFDNVVNDNHGQNVAAEGAYAFLPTSAGVMVMAGRNVHVFNNEIGGNGTANVIVAAYRDSFRDAAYSPLPHNVMIRDNRFGAAGTSPPGEWAALGVSPLPDVIWDGADTYFSVNGPRTDFVRVVMNDNRSTRGGIGSFLSLGLNAAGAPLSEAAPNPNYPPLLEIEEPERVRID